MASNIGTDPVNQVQQSAQAAIAPRRESRLRAIAFGTYLLVAIAVIGVLAVLAHTTAYFDFDLQITLALQTVQLPWFSTLMIAVTEMGRPIVPGLLTTGIPVIALYFLGLRWEAVVALFAGAGGEGFAQLIKLLVNRPRPATDIVHVFTAGLRDTSFPSGHVVHYTAFFGFLFFLTFILLKTLWQRSVLLMLFGSLVLLVGPSRIYLGEHWFSDVLAAYLIGTLWLALSIRLYHWGKPRFFVHQPTAPPVKPI